MANHIIEELEQLLDKTRIDVAALEKTIAFLRECGYTRTEAPSEASEPVTVAKTPSEPPRKQKTSKIEYGGIGNAVKAAILQAPAQFTRKDIEAILPSVSKAVAARLTKASLAEVLNKLRKTGHLIRKPIPFGNTLAVYALASREKQATAPKTAEPDKFAIAEAKAIEKAKKQGALRGKAPTGFMCNDCGETYEKAPQQCVKCGKSSFEQLT